MVHFGPRLGKVNFMLRAARLVSVTTFAVLIALLPLVPVLAEAQSQPTVVSFTMTPDSIDTANQNNIVIFDLVVSNSTGISSAQTKVVLTNNYGTTLSTYLLRTDVPINISLQKVTFHGSIKVPSSALAGTYTATADPVTGLNADGSAGYSTPILKATTTSTVLGATNNLLVRSNGNLNFSYVTFVGPTFNNLLGGSFVDSKYSSVPAPIWKVGETLKPSSYYELKVPTLSLKISSSTPTTCTSDGATLSFIAIGGCAFTVYTDQTKDYQSYKDVESVMITAPRVKPTYNVGGISTQSSAILPLKISGPLVFASTGEIISPISATPTVCYGFGSYITIISGGTCTLNYSSPATSSYLASDVYPLTFEVMRSAQSLTFNPPGTIGLTAKSLSLTASASSGQAVSITSNTPAICSVTGNSLNLLTAGGCQIVASQAGTATIAPVTVTASILITGFSPAAKRAPKKVTVVKKVSCLKGGKVKTFVGSDCPKGYRLRK